MQHSCTLYVLTLHAIASSQEAAKHFDDENITEDTMLRMWTTIGGLIVAGEVSRRRNARAQSSMDYHLTAVCLCAICTVLLYRLMCPAFAYCFLLHATCSVAVSVMVDHACAFSTRVIAGFMIPFAAFGILLAPRKLEISSMAFFTTHQSKAFQDMNFETGHLWGITAASAIRIVVNTVFVLWRRLY